MAVKLKATDIPIDPKFPYQNDLLNRVEFATNLSEIIGKAESPCVIAIDAAWGTGKTTFIKMWTKDLINQSFSVVEFNAWKNDYSGNAMVALSVELTKELQNLGLQSDTVEKLKKGAVQIFEKSIVAGVKLATSGILDISPLLNGNHNSSKELQDYVASCELIENFIQNLKNYADGLKKERPLIVVIDELDRCRPLYAIELLEAAKHLFSVKNIIFILAVNRRELGHSIKAIYGNEFDSQEYLRRFIDVNIPLPAADRENYISNLMHPLTRDNFRRGGSMDKALSLILKVFGSPDISLRNIAHYMYRLNLITITMTDELFVHTVVALLAREIDSENYSSFNFGEISDEQFSKSLFSQIGMRGLKYSSERALIDAMLISARSEMSAAKLNHENEERTPLLDKYRQIIDSESSSKYAREEIDYANEVCAIIDRENREGSRVKNQLGKNYIFTIERIELILPK